MARLWINNSLEDRIVMLDRTTETHKGMVRKMARMYIHEILSKELDEQLKAMGVEGYVIPELFWRRFFFSQKNSRKKSQDVYA